MLIWLGKQYLDQKDKKEVSAEDGSNVIYMSYDPKKLKPSETKS